MHRVIASLFALLLSVFLLVMGNGLHGTLLPVRARLEGFSFTQIGLLGTVYFVGFLLGCLLSGRVIRQVGHIRTFAIFAAVAAQIPLAQAFFLEPIPWFLTRAVTGFCFAGLAMVIESWLNDQVTNDIRGKAISIYRLVELAGILIGQFLFAIIAPTGFAAFTIIASLVACSLIPVAATRSSTPKTVGNFSINIPKLWRVSQTALITCIVIGLANGAFWTLAPLYAFALTQSQIWVTVFMSLMIIGGGLAIWPMGAWSDRVDRRIPIFACTLIVLGTCALAVVGQTTSIIVLSVTALFYGAGAMPQYGLAIAHANDSASESEFVEISSTILFVYGIGAIVGPILASVFMQIFSPKSMFYFIGVIHIVSALFTLIRMLLIERKPKDKENYVPVPRTTQNIFEVDPRSEDRSD
jgi:MFS family permease